MALTFIIGFLAVSQILAFAIALIARSWPLDVESVEMHGIDVERARGIVGSYIENIHDTRFGFPTGVFRVDPEKSTANQLVAHEVNFSGSSGFSIAKFGFAIPFVLAAAVADESAGAAMAMFIVGVAVAALVVGPILLIAAIEIILRALMRSRVTATLEPIVGEDAVKVQIALRGLSSFGARKSLLRGLSKPILPVAYGGSPMGMPREPWTKDRLSVVYASGATLAVIGAFLVAVLAPRVHLNPNSSGGASGANADAPLTPAGSTSTSSGPATPSGSASPGSTTNLTPTQTSTSGSSSTAGSNNTYTGQAFSISYPSGWQVADSEQNKGDYTDTTIVSSTDKNTLIRVDVTANPPSSDPMTDAQPVINALQKQDNYQQIALGTTTFQDPPSVRWEFFDRESGVRLHKVDVFFTDKNGDSVAVLTQAPASEYAGLAGQFGILRQTLAVN